VNERVLIEGKRIVFVLPGLNLGGAERQALLLARYLIHEHYADVRVLGFGKPGKVAELCDAVGIPWHSLDADWPPNRLGRVRAAIQFGLSLRQYKPDILLPYCWFPNMICGLSWRLSGARLCVWNQRDEGRHFSGTRLGRLSAKLMPKFISNSKHGADFLVEELNVNRENIAVVHNGIEFGGSIETHFSWRERLQLSSGDFVACMVANLHHFKDHATLLRAWRQVVDQLGEDGHSAVLLLAGRFDTTHDMLKALAYDLELGKNVRFLGQVSDIEGLLGSVDLGIFSSRKEGCPNGVLECMAASLAVTGTDIPGIREAVGETGYPWLAPPGDAEALARHILTLARDTNLRERLGDLNRQRIVEHFTPEQMVCETVALLDTW
jgi:glycosyltransferase involved in cell wall biosynthesis